MVKRQLLLLLFLQTLTCEMSLGEQQEMPAELEEAQHLNDLETEKDTEDIYEYGLIGQEHPEVKGIMKVSVSTFKYLMKLGYFFNYHQNFVDGLYIRDDPNTSNYDYKKNMNIGMENYLNCKGILKLIRGNFKDVKKDIDEFYNNLELITMSVDESLEFFGLQKYFDSTIYQHGRQDPGVRDMVTNMDLIIFEFINKVKKYFESIDLLRILDKVVIRMIKPFIGDITGAEHHDVLGRIDAGVALVDTVISIKKQVQDMIDALKSSVQVIKDTKFKLIKEMQAYRGEFAIPIHYEATHEELAKLNEDEFRERRLTHKTKDKGKHV